MLVRGVNGEGEPIIGHHVEASLKGVTTQFIGVECNYEEEDDGNPVLWFAMFWHPVKEFYRCSSVKDYSGRLITEGDKVLVTREDGFRCVLTVVYKDGFYLFNEESGYSLPFLNVVDGAGNEGYTLEVIDYAEAREDSQE